MGVVSCPRWSTRGSQRSGIGFYSDDLADSIASQGGRMLTSPSSILSETNILTTTESVQVPVGIKLNTRDGGGQSGE